MDVDDYYPQGKRWRVCLHEKSGKQHKMPAHHLLESYFDAYVTAAGLTAQKNVPLFCTLGGRGRKELTADRNMRQDARCMIVHRAKDAGRCRGLAATASAPSPLNGRLLEYAQQMAAGVLRIALGGFRANRSSVSSARKQRRLAAGLDISTTVRAFQPRKSRR